MSYSTLRGVKNLDALNALPSQWASNFSEEVHVTAAVDTVAPLTPSSFAVNGVAEGITLTWENPTLDDDGTNCYDLSDIAIYRSTSASIDITNDATYDKRTLVDGEAYTFPTSDTTQTYYFVITAIDTSGNESTASAELSDTSNKPIGPDPVIPDDASGLIFDDTVGGDGVVEGYAMMGIAFQPPPSSVVGLRSIRLWYQYTDDAGSNWRDEDGVADQWTELYPDGYVGFLHKDTLLQTNIGTRAYRYKATFIGEDDTTESSTADTAGGTTTVCVANNDNLVAVSIFASRIVCLGEVTADSIKASTITADKLSFTAYVIGTNDLDDIVDGTTYSKVLTTDIDAGHIKLSESVGDLDDIDDGSTYGRVATTSISAGKIVVAGLDSDATTRMFTDDTTRINVEAWKHASDATAIDGGNIYATSVITAGTGNNVGVLNGTDATYRIYAGHATPASAPFRVTQAGVLYATGAVISGSITITGGSGYANISDKPTSLSDINGTEGTKLSGIATGADVTADNTAAAITGQGNLATRNTVNATYIDNDSITTAKIAANAVTATEINVSTLSAISANMGTITAGTISAGTVSATTLTTGTLNFASISRSGLSVANGEIAANAVRSNQLYIDGDINFSDSGINGIYGIDAIRRGSSITDGSKPSLVFGTASCQLHAGTGGTAYTEVKGVVSVTISASAGDVSLTATDDIIFDAADDIKLDAAGEIDFIGTDQGSISYLDGPDYTIRVKHNGVVRLLGLWDE